MSDFEDFFIENTNTIEEKEVKFKRFKKAFKIKPLSADEVDSIKNDCTKTVAVAGKKGRYTKELDVNKFNTMLVAASVTYPSLDNSKLQDNYGVKSAEELIKKMLYAGEFDELAMQCQALSGYDVDTNDLVEDAKN